MQALMMWRLEVVRAVKMLVLVFVVVDCRLVVVMG
jgi:hypothetical protein